MSPVIWLPEALDDVSRLYDFLEGKSVAAAQRMALVLKGQARYLEKFPEAGRPMGDELGLRELFVAFGEGAYVLRYKIHKKRVIVIRVWHCRELR
jgi:plasmid stabilization system protein ParE